VRQLENIQKYPILRVATTLDTEFRPPGPEDDECDTSLHAAIIDETTIKINETIVNAVTRPPNHKTSPYAIRMIVKFLKNSIHRDG